MSRRHPTCDVSSLKAFLEERLGGRLVRFDWIDTAARTCNFLCVTARGEKFVVKCVSTSDALRLRPFRERLIPHLNALKDTPEAVHLAYGPWEFGDHWVVALTFAAGRPIRPDRLSAEEATDLIRAYGAFSDAIQRVSPVLPCTDTASLLEEVLSLLEPHECRDLSAFVQREIPLEVLAYDPARLHVIHGDFHCKNFHFDGPRVGAFFDFESFRLGYPAEDWIRYLIAGAEHINPINFFGHRRRIAFLERLLPLYPIDEWRLAVDTQLLSKIRQRFRNQKESTARLMLHLRYRFRVYFELHRRIRACETSAAKGGAA